MIGCLPGTWADIDFLAIPCRAAALDVETTVAIFQMEFILTRIALFMIAVLSAVTASLSAARSEPLPSPACIYKSETYGEGAYLYPNRLLLLACTIEAGRPQWKVIPISKLNDLRSQGSSSISAATAPEPTATQASDPPKAAGNDQKCFAFNGKRYCQ